MHSQAVISLGERSNPVTAAALSGSANDARQPFLIKPYLLFGASAAGGATVSLRLSWATRAAENHVWSAEMRTRASRSQRWHHWRCCNREDETVLRITGLGHLRLHTVEFTDLPPGRRIEYRLRRDGQIVFVSRATAPKSAGMPVRFVVLGDGADGSETASRVGRAAAACQPDFALFAGDNAYEDGRPSEFVSHFFGNYNSDAEAGQENSQTSGAALLSRVPCALAAGNHDVRTPGFEHRADQDADSDDLATAVVPGSLLLPDILGYFKFFKHPANGPDLSACEIKSLATGKKKRKRIARFAGQDFLSRTNYSFDYGDVHVTVLDGNKYADWSNPYLRKWVEQDLQSTRCLWKVVVIHQPPFTGCEDYAREQRNRWLCDIFQENGVDVVFSGHCHAYERSHPLRFFVSPEALPGDELVPGTFALDRQYDGKLNTRANGVIYVVSGTAGHIEEFPHHPGVHEFTAKTIGCQPSYTLCDVRGGTLIIRQMAPDATELDSFMLDK